MITQRVLGERNWTCSSCSLCLPRKSRTVNACFVRLKPYSERCRLEYPWIRRMVSSCYSLWR